MVNYGLDREVSIIKKHLEKKLKWQNVDFHGRVYKNPTKSDNGKMIPEIYSGAKNYQEVFTNDLKSGTVFFSDSFKHTVENTQHMQTDLSIIFILNLSQLKGDNLRNDIEVQHEVLELLVQLPQFELADLTIGLNALNDFDTSKIKLSDMQPWHIFSITGKIKYNINNC
ncbi:hypothetical protein MG290_01650 [Flavobacterium sp. CBA20B-1]|uniref:hypothetical protein n=1 Tax=unclassified Flavobacterium TaxID=196869 RepID=UPI002224AC2D|nr:MULTISPECIES: hypothetical protein [unclassified Flavobacterium]WCM42400.1 hypothetical protein MG290_01650 [Flavobacterium sp. CBA20B-1]